MPVTKKRGMAKTKSQLSVEESVIYHSLIEDYDKQFMRKLDEIYQGRDAFLKSLKGATNLAILNIHKEVRKKTVAELGFFVSAQNPSGTDSSSKGRGQDNVFKSLADTVNGEVQENLQSSRKRTVKKTKTTTSQFMAAPSTAVRRSSRKRVPKHLDVETPVNSTRSTGRGGLSLATPMITPKFDMNTPYHKSVMRVAKPNEKLVSLSGSPVCASTVKKSKKAQGVERDHMAIPLGLGKTIMIPMSQMGADDQSYMDLDDEAKSKLLQVRSTLDNLLKMKADQ